MKTLRAVNVVIVGGGWSGLLMAKELGSRTSLSVVVLERGEPHSAGPTDYTAGMDELDYVTRSRLMQDYSQETVTLRHTPRERALPIRQLGSFLPGTGIGGAGEHWGALFPRYTPDLFELRTKTIERYGVEKLPENHSIQDWGVTWQEIEPYYAKAEQLVGISGKAGNLNGKKIEGGNVFEGPRSTEYPMPPLKTASLPSLFNDAAKSLGYHPYPNACAVNSKTYKNSDGLSRPGCFYCGFCDHYGCMIGAKSQPSNTLLPIVAKQKSVTIRANTTVRRIVADSAKTNAKVRGVSYIDASGEEVFQPADLVFVATWTFNNTRLLMLSNLGEPYDPATGKGTLGKNLTHQIQFGVQAFFDKPLNRFMGAGGVGVRMSDFDGDAFDHSQLPFLRGGIFYATSTGAQPIASFGVVPRAVKSRWGSEWKKAAIDCYDRTGTVTFAGEHIAYKSNFMSLDPTYKDHLGDPLLCLTLDWNDNERKMAEFALPKSVELIKTMGGKDVISFPGYAHYDATRYQSTHVQGGTIMSPSPETGVLNPYSQHWQYSNLFVLGASAFPQQGAANPTPTILALTLRTADAIVDRYTKTPGSLL
jgi:gluconate 2-dehydrogenase alpha chain